MRRIIIILFVLAMFSPNFLRAETKEAGPFELQTIAEYIRTGAESRNAAAVFLGGIREGIFWLAIYGEVQEGWVHDYDLDCVRLWKGSMLADRLVAASHESPDMHVGLWMMKELTSRCLNTETESEPEKTLL